MEEKGTEGILFLSAMLQKGERMEDLLPKALSAFLFREVIEDVHSKYNISQEEMMRMNKEVCNRAKLFVDEIMPDPVMQMAFMVEAIQCNDWDAPEITKAEKSRLKAYEDIASQLRAAMSKQ